MIWEIMIVGILITFTIANIANDIANYMIQKQGTKFQVDLAKENCRVNQQTGEIEHIPHN